MTDALRAKYKEKMSIDKRTWREMLGVGQMIALFIEGKQQLFFNPFSKTYAPVEIKTASAHRPRGMNVMQFYATKHDQQWLGSNPNIQIVAQGDDERIAAAAKAADIVLEHYERKCYTVPFSRSEAKMAQCFGTVINRVQFDPQLKGGKVIKEIVEDREIDISEGYGECECGHMGTAKEFNETEIMPGVSMPQCAACGSRAVSVEPPVKSVMPMVVGQEPVEYGDIVVEMLPLPACRWDLRVQAEESSWFITEKITNIGEVHLKLGKVKLKDRDRENPGHDIMDAITQLGTPVGGESTTGMQNSRDGKAEHEVISTEMFLSPEDLWDIRSKQDEKTVSGEVIPKGVRLSELFPDGACVCGLNGLDIITGIYAESHKKQVTSGAYYAKALSGVGRGMADMIETQKRVNASDNQIYDYHQSLATPAVLYAKGAIKQDEAQYLGNPKVNIPVDLQHFPEIKSLEQVVSPMRPQGAAGLFYEYAYNTLANFMQLQSHVTEFSGGLPNVNNKTATGAQITSALGQSLFTPLLAGKVGLRLGNAKNIIETFREHFPFPKYFASKFRGKNRIEKGRFFQGADCEGDFEFYVEKDSEIPRNLYTKRQEMFEMFTGVFGGYPNYLAAKAQNPDEVNAILRQYNIEIEGDTSDTIGEICRARLDEAFQLADQQAAQLQAAFGASGAEYLDPSQILVSLSSVIEPLELEHEEQLKWYARYFHTDEGLKLDAGKRAIVNAFIATHFTMAQNQQMVLQTAAAEIQAAAAGPMMEMQAAQGQQQLEQQSLAAQMEQEQAEADLENQAGQELIKTGGQAMRDKMKVATKQAMATA